MSVTKCVAVGLLVLAVATGDDLVPGSVVGGGAVLSRLFGFTEYADLFDLLGHAGFGDIVAVCDVDAGRAQKARNDPKIGKGKADAYGDYRKVLEIDPQNLEAADSLDRIFRTAERYDELSAVLQQKADIYENLNDKTLEGFSHTGEPIFSVQYHPEASPGPHDATYLFDCFVDMMKSGKAPTAEEMAAAQAKLERAVPEILEGDEYAGLEWAGAEREEMKLLHRRR